MQLPITIHLCLALVIPMQISVAQELIVRRSDTQLTVQSGDRDLLTYNIASPPVPKDVDPIYERSGFLHPVYTLSGGCVTATFPADHEHQHGIFSAWTRTRYDGRSVDFWNLAQKTGRVCHEKITGIKEKEGKVSCDIDLRHEVLGDSSVATVAVLREHWKITVYPPADDFYWFDIESTQTPLTDKPLEVEKYIYGGQGYRGPVSWLQPDDEYAKNHSEHTWSGATMLTSEGQGRLDGNHTHVKWAAIQGAPVSADGLTPIDSGKVASIAVLSHASNFRFPQAVRLHPSKPYFSFSPCVDGPFVIEKPNAYVSKFRYVVSDKPMDAKWLNQQWESWHESVK